MLNVRLADDHLYGKLLFTWLSLVMPLILTVKICYFSAYIRLGN